MKNYKTKAEKAFLKEWTLFAKHTTGCINFTWRRTEIPQGNWDTRAFGTNINTNPTSNCQLLSAQAFEGAIMDINTNLQEIGADELPLYEMMSAELIKVIFSITNSHFSSKPMLLLDTVNAHTPKVKKMLRGISRWNPTNTFTYVSSNKTIMRTSVVKLNFDKFEDYHINNNPFHKVMVCGHDGVPDNSYALWKLNLRR